MEDALKKSIIKILKSFINKIENGYCDNLTQEQYNKLITGFSALKDVEESIKTKRKWRFFMFW
jgi:hypothetical protein